jgi:1,2-diacylglycerol 3-alpha-glucosyltransferase
MKIAIFTDTYKPQMNGVVAYLSNCVESLSKKHEVILFAPGDKELKIEKKDNLKIYWIPSSPFPFYEGYKIASMDYKRISEILKKEKPDVIHAHAPVILGVQGMIAAKRQSIPTVITHHTHFPDYVPYLLDGKLPKAFDKFSKKSVEKLIKQVYKNADVVTAPTQELVNELSAYGLDNVTLLPNGIKLKRFVKNQKAVDALKKKLEIGDDKKVVVYLGRISFEKKLDVLLKAFRKIENNNRMLLIAGSGPYLEGIKQLAEELEIKNIRFSGFLEDDEIPAAYACGEVFASASDTETFGLTFVEAMNMELPVVGVAMFGAKELIKPDKNGFLVEPGDIDKFAEAMERLLKNKKLRTKLGKTGHEMAKKYSLQNSIKKTLEIYKKVIEST